MATESVCPLTSVLGSQTVLEICLGLHDILKALIFLHEKVCFIISSFFCIGYFLILDYKFPSTNRTLHGFSF